MGSEQSVEAQQKFLTLCGACPPNLQQISELFQQAKINPNHVLHADGQYIFPFHPTPLTAAINNNQNPEVVKFLLKNQANPSLQSRIPCIFVDARMDIEPQRVPHSFLNNRSDFAKSPESGGWYINNGDPFTLLLFVMFAFKLEIRLFAFPDKETFPSRCLEIGKLLLAEMKQQAKAPLNKQQYIEIAVETGNAELFQLLLDHHPIVCDFSQAVCQNTNENVLHFLARQPHQISAASARATAIRMMEDLMSSGIITDSQKINFFRTSKEVNYNRTAFEFPAFFNAVLFACSEVVNEFIVNKITNYDCADATEEEQIEFEMNTGNPLFWCCKREITSQEGANDQIKIMQTLLTMKQSARWKNQKFTKGGLSVWRGKMLHNSREYEPGCAYNAAAASKNQMLIDLLVANGVVPV